MALVATAAPAKAGQRRVVQVEELGVRLRSETHRVRSLREYLLLGRRHVGRVSWFEALSGITVSLQAGELLGVVGDNGAGKTTFLRVLAGIVPPSEGRVSVAGAIAPLVEMGAGFDVELTGRENVFLYGAMLGLDRRRVAGLFDVMVDFAGLQDSMDTAVKNYSSGMVARLGFSVATAVPPALLLVDEALAVGDANFRLRCSDRIDRLREQGTVVVLVSHDLELVRSQADTALWLHEGRVGAVGEVGAVLAAYQAQLERGGGEVAA